MEVYSGSYVMAAVTFKPLQRSAFFAEIKEKKDRYFAEKKARFSGQPEVVCERCHPGGVGNCIIHLAGILHAVCVVGYVVVRRFRF